VEGAVSAEGGRAARWRDRIERRGGIYRRTRT